ncbi:hypothetical protein P20652_1109 [Pseudoalteromonas sp. BSi20652]|nr:hypothetical protein P20652_1109 [Pseudoalteromonas sp. BSi20652]
MVRVVTDVETTRDYLQTQMGSHAQDTATSLGLSISPYLDSENLVIAETMATAIFDSGYYKKLNLQIHKAKLYLIWKILSVLSLCLIGLLL